MAISTIKYVDNIPVRAKYRIVALRNLDPINWSKSECYAPVMSMMEIRLLASLAVRHKSHLKSGDIRQAFAQSELLPDETYVVRPPAGCPRTPPNSYWLLQRDLCGLRRAPRHWLDRMSKILQSIGFTPCPNSPCVFHGELIPGQPPIYLGLYVDDFIYFSESDQVKQEFETRLAKHTPVDFMGKVSHFVGVKFQWTETPTKLSVHLSQQAFTENLIEMAGLLHDSATTKPSPYRSGMPVDSIPHKDIPPNLRIIVQSFL